VFKAGRVGASATFQYTRPFANAFGQAMPAQGSVGPGLGWHPGMPYEFAASDVDPFREFWQAFKTARTHGMIKNAVRRFDYAADRSLPEDKIVDLLIAAESLFLSDQSGTELGFRLSARVAALLGADVDERLALSTFMRRAYSARSKIVHGDTLKEKDLRDLGDDRVDIHGSVAQLSVRRGGISRQSAVDP
jgi:hypothetical protein